MGIAIVVVRGVEGSDQTDGVLSEMELDTMGLTGFD